VLDGFYKARFTKSDGETILGFITLANGKLLVATAISCDLLPSLPSFIRRVCSKLQ
jgi:hypothetical protein